MENEKIMLELVSIVRKMNYLDQMPYEYVEGEKLYPAEIHSIEVIGQYPEMNQTEIAAKLDVTKGAVSRMVKKLEQKGLVTKRRMPDNKKDIYLGLTERGQKIFQFHEESHKWVNDFYMEQFSAMSEEERTGVAKFVHASAELLNEWLEKM